MRLIDARTKDRPPPAHPIWDVRHRDGGLFDLETLIQLWQLRHAPDNPELSTTSPAAVFSRSGELGLLDTETVHGLSEAHYLLRQLDNLRAVAGEGVIDPTTAPAGSLLALNRAASVPDQPPSKPSSTVPAATSFPRWKESRTPCLTLRCQHFIL